MKVHTQAEAYHNLYDIHILLINTLVSGSRWLTTVEHMHDRVLCTYQYATQML